MTGKKTSKLDLTREDGLSVRRLRARHDEAQPPRGHELQHDCWPVWKPPAGSRKPTDDDIAIGHAVIAAVQWMIGESEHYKPGPKDTPMSDERRARLEVAYKTLEGHPWGYLRDRNNRRQWELTRNLAQLLRLREQARVYKRIRSHKGMLDAPRANGRRVGVPPPPPPEERRPGLSYHPGGDVDEPPIAMTGAEIVKQLRTLNAIQLLDDSEAARLASSIDLLPDDAINLGGPGGPGGGRVPEAWARNLLLVLDSPKAALALAKKRAKRRPRAV